MAHPKYFDDDGKQLPSVTQILGIIDKPWLINWAYNVGKRGDDLSAIRTNSTSVGSVVHGMIEADLKGEEVSPPTDLQEELLVQVITAWNQYIIWKSEHADFEMVYSEESMVSNLFGYGGTLDALFLANEEYILVDFKTSNMIAQDYWIQLIAYSQLLYDTKRIKAKKIAILRLDKDKSVYEFPTKDVETISEYELYWNYFLALLKVYPLYKSLRNRKE